MERKSRRYILKPANIETRCEDGGLLSINESVEYGNSCYCEHPDFDSEAETDTICDGKQLLIDVFGCPDYYVAIPNPVLEGVEINVAITK